MSKWAPDNDEGLHAYVIETTGWAGTRTYTDIKYASNLLEAKVLYGHTRQMHTSIKVRRAKVEDVEL